MGLFSRKGKDADHDEEQADEDEDRGGGGLPWFFIKFAALFGLGFLGVGWIGLDRMKAAIEREA